MFLTVTVDKRNFDKSMSGILKRSRSSRPAYSQIATRMEAATVRRFNTTSAPNGKSWKPLAESTIRQRREGSAKPLNDTGTLRSSIQSLGMRRRAIAFSSLNYARIHNKGGKAGKGRKVTIPQRQFLGLSAKEIKRYNRLLQTYIVKGLV